MRRGPGGVRRRAEGTRGGFGFGPARGIRARRSISRFFFFFFFGATTRLLSARLRTSPRLRARPRARGRRPRALTSADVMLPRQIRARSAVREPSPRLADPSSRGGPPLGDRATFLFFPPPEGDVGVVVTGGVRRPAVPPARRASARSSGGSSALPPRSAHSACSALSRHLPPTRRCSTRTSRRLRARWSPFARAVN